MDLVDWAYQHGIMRLYLDEVHRYEKWSVTLKNIYDDYPDMSIVYTSSSLLIMDNAKVDLSRRQTVYTLYGMSFREFLSYEGIATLDAITFDDLLSNHVRHAMQITKEVKIAPLFEAYFKHGYYPFYRESIVNYHFNVDLIFSRLRERHISKKSLGFKICPILRIRRPLSALPRLWEEVYNCKG